MSRFENDFSYDLLKVHDNQEIKNYVNEVRKEVGSDFYIGIDTNFGFPLSRE